MQFLSCTRPEAYSKFQIMSLQTTTNEPLVTASLKGEVGAQNGK